MLNSKRSRTITNNTIADNEDVMTEILLRLPTKSLIRFKSVSKQLRRLISNPLFGCLHCRRNPSLVSGLFLYRLSHPHNPEFNFILLKNNNPQSQFNSAPLDSLSFVDGRSDIRTLQSCNGLLCVGVFNYENHSNGYSYYVCNPTTKQSVKLPLLNGPLVSSILSINLAFDPSNSLHYKAVCVWVSAGSGGRYRFATYSSETGLWRDSGYSLEVQKDDCYLFKKGVFWHGAIHWISKSGPFLCFDVDRECFKAMPATPIPEGRKTRRVRYFGESRGHLHLVEINWPPTKWFDVLEMEGDYSGWTVKYRVDLDAVTTAFPQMVRHDLYPGHRMRYFFCILCLLREETEEKSRLVLSIPGKTISYDLINNTIEKLDDIRSRHLHLKLKGLTKYKWYYAYQYIETLCSV